MKLSQRGLELIQSFEGYHTAQPDGSCVAYLCPARVPTIGWGCTEGVKLGMRWTREEADAAFMRELEKFEFAVQRLVTVEMNQNEFDALTSFAYNCGEGALGKSTILRKLNKGDRKGAAAAFHMWNKGGGRVLPGLVRRRREEAELFLKPVQEAEEELMPQSVEASRQPMSPAVAHTATATGTTGVNTLLGNGLPKPPDFISSGLSTIGSWRGLGASAAAMAASAWEQPMLLLLIAGLVVAAIWYRSA